ncbi:alanine racemase [Phycicoccus duodecadis]|uniref:D-serine deaminase-like pyridoxal phosphate-dependent protein n=1 Tax=Phycicoccus duodecadis TaxID=173053 RepID=A0A2N3YHS7_9MICO|nr:alanine racemase [Phycicoccus duodecadis]PKW26403.1 D-serine deaminase-like pyridoxal phosphate-dependent protein [Phycicoccus duodecadis]
MGPVPDDVTRGWDAATAGLPAPLVVLDLDAYEANAADLVRRAAGRPIRVASKSLRCRWVLADVLARPGFAGVMGYAVAEAVWLVRSGLRDVFVAYPSADVEGVRTVAGDAGLRREVTLTVDSVEHVRWLRDTLGPAVSGVGVAVDVDASVRVGRAHLGVRRSPTRTPAEALAVVRAATGVGLEVRGLMFYDAQVAGLPDSAAVRLLKRRSVHELTRRRAAVVEAVRAEVDLRFVNGGGTGSLHTYGDDSAVTELASGSGLYAPTLFDGYDAFSPRPAMAYALPVVRRPARGIVTTCGGGYVASGEPGWSRVPSPVRAGLSLLRTEAAGEVQTPVEGDVDDLGLGDRVWMRGAKAGELLERFDTLHLVRGSRLVESVPTYRGEGRNFG